MWFPPIRSLLQPSFSSHGTAVGRGCVRFVLQRLDTIESVDDVFNVPGATFIAVTQLSKVIFGRGQKFIAPRSYSRVAVIFHSLGCV
jgi:hypothetical protein